MRKDYWLQKLVTDGDLGKRKENVKDLRIA